MQPAEGLPAGSLQVATGGRGVHSIVLECTGEGPTKAVEALRGRYPLDGLRRHSAGIALDRPGPASKNTLV